MVQRVAGQAASPGQCCPNYKMPNGVSGPQWIKNTKLCRHGNRGSFLWCGLTFIPICISNYIHHEVWDKITYPFPNISAAALEAWEWRGKFIPHFTEHVITYPWLLIQKWPQSIRQTYNINRWQTREWPNLTQTRSKTKLFWFVSIWTAVLKIW